MACLLVKCVQASLARPESLLEDAEAACSPRLDVQPLQRCHALAALLAAFGVFALLRPFDLQSPTGSQTTFSERLIKAET